MKMMSSSKVWILFLLLLAAGLLSACSRVLPAASAQSNDVSIASRDDESRTNGGMDSAADVIVEGRLLPRETAWLAFGQPGLVVEVLVEEGQQVSQGDVLGRLNGRERVEAQLAAAKLERLNAQQELDDLIENAPLTSSTARQKLTAAEKMAIDARQMLDDLDTDDFQQKLDDTKLAVEDAQDELEDAQEEYDKYQDLDADSSNRKNAEDALEEAQQTYDDAVEKRDLFVNQLEAARANVSQAEATLEGAHREVDARRSGPDPDELALTQSRLENAIALVTASQAALEDLEIVAPFDGTVLKLEIAPNERVVPNEPVVSLADRSTWYVDTSDLTEIEVVQVQPGDPAILTPDAMPELELAGVVEKISDMYTEKSGDILYTVRIRLDETDPRLRWGMTMQVNLQEK
jgi:multidrug resistance efflux pump